MVLVLLLALLLCGVVLGDFTITTSQELIDFSTYVNSGTSYSGTTVYLSSDLDFTSDLLSRFAPIGNEDRPFKGTFDGKGHLIRDFTLSSSFQYVGLFGYLNEAIIKNIVMDSSCSVVSSYSDDFFVNVGGIVGYCIACIIEYIVNMASVTFTGNVRYLYLGGITGRFDSGTVRNCVNYGSVTNSGTKFLSNINVGGIGGICNGDHTKIIQNCANYGTLSHKGRPGNLCMGGILGNSFQGTVFIENCLSAGTIVKSARTAMYVGSIVGYADTTTIITHCYWTSDVGCDTVYGHTEPSSSVITTDNSLAELSTTTTSELNIYASKNSTWDKWIMLYLNGGKINDISLETLIVTQKYLPDPVNQGRKFMCWCTNTECTEKYEPGITDIAKVTGLYALWDVSIPVFDFGNGTRVSKKVAYGEKYGDLPDAGEREGHSFNGWFTEEDGKGEQVTSEAAVSDTFTILYAHWAINNYTLIFIFDNGDNDEVRILNYSEIIEYPTNVERKGYTLSGWLNYTVSMPAQNLIITAQWIPNNYTVRFNATGGDASEYERNVTYDDVYGDLPGAEKEGYNFAGWFTEEENEAKIAKDTKVAIDDDHTLYAHWSINNYTLTFIFNNSKSDEVRILNYNDTIEYPEDPVREGFTFKGWDKNITTMPARNLNITAQWTINNYTLIFIFGNGKSDEVRILNYSEIIEYPTNVEMKGYTFSGWLNYTASMPAYNLIITAQWTPNNYTVTFNSTGGVALEYVKNVAYDDVYGKLPEAGKREGYSFVGWFTEDGGNGVKITEDTKVEIDDDHTLYAQWIINNYTLTFIFNNGKSDEVRILNYNETIEYPEDVREGYSFNGWDNEDITAMPAHNLNITAQWAINNYTLTFIFDNGKSDEVRILNYNETIEYPDDPAREGFTFNGWSSKLKTMPARSITITAQWIKVEEITPSEFVEIVLGKKDLSEEEVKAIVSTYTTEEYAISKIETDKESGETKVIIKFIDKETAESFVESVKQSSDIFTNAIIMNVNFIAGYAASITSLFYPSLLAYKILF